MTQRIESVCLYVLLVVIALRPLISEDYSSARTAVTAGFTELDSTSPAATLWLDTVILAAAAGWLVAQAIERKNRYRPCGLEWGLVLIAVAGFISCWRAGNHRLAINATVDWLCLVILAIVLVQLLRRRWQVRLLLSVVLASAAVQAYECLNQVLYSFPATQQMYEQTREEFWQQRGVELDSPQVALFESRMNAREASGFMAHSNVAGAYLVMTGLAALGVGWSRWRAPAEPLRRLFAGAVLGLGVGLLIAAGLTHSKGALIAGALGIIVWAIRWVMRYPIETHRRRALGLAWGLAVGGALAVVGYGLHHGRLPGASLDFRWKYWTNTAKLIRHESLLGVGRENFGRHYLAHKAIDSPEEISNPHNFLVTATAEWGVLGLAGILALLVGGSVAVTQPRLEPRPDPDETGGRPLRWGLLIGAITFGLRLLLLGSDNPAFLIVSTVIPALVWALTYALLSTESNRIGTFRNDWLPGLTIGLNCALLAFLVQDTISFAFFVPAAATTFFALAAAVIAEQRMTRPAHQEDRASIPNAVHSRSRWPWAAAAGVAIVGLHLFWFVRPVASSSAALAHARTQSRIAIAGMFRDQPAYRAYERAARADRLDPTPLAESAAWLIRYARIAPDRRAAAARATELMATAMERDPQHAALATQQMRICREAARITTDDRYRQLALDAARRAVDLYPQSPAAHAELGEQLFRNARHTNDARAITQALNHLTRAIDLDDARPAWETLRRFPPSRRRHIEATIIAVKALAESTSRSPSQ